MYEKFYGLRERPFTIMPNPHYLYMSQKHKLALAHLRYGLSEGTGVVVLTGEMRWWDLSSSRVSCFDIGCPKRRLYSSISKMTQRTGPDRSHPN